MPKSGFVHLHTHSEYSLLDGAARVDGLVKRAAALDMPALALTDHGVMYGALDFYHRAKKAGVKPIVGVEAYVAPGDRRDRTPRADKADKNAYHLLLLAQNETGYRNLLKLSTFAAVEGFYYKPRIDHELLEKYNEGIIATSACLGGEVCAALLRGNYDKARDIAAWYRDLFSRDRYFIELQNHTLPQQIQCNEQLLKIAAELKLQVLCTNDVHYLGQADAYAHDVLLCIGTGATIHDAKRMRMDAEEFYMKSAEEMHKAFADHPEALEQTLAIADMCNLELEFGRAPLPVPDMPDGISAQAHLANLSREGLAQRLGSAPEKYHARLEYELGIVEQTGFAQYILIVRDFAKFAREKGIFFGVRGSAAGSLASFCLGITDIDPVDYDLTFERFLNPERVQMPDIDMDFEDSRRAEVIEYVTQKYGEGHVAQIITFGTLGARAALKDAGRALAMPLSDVNRLAGMIPTMPLHVSIDQALETNPEFKAAYRADEKVRGLVDTAKRLEGLSRHSSVHAAGVVISHEPLVNYTPLQRSADGGLVTQYPAATLEEIGLLKMDFLGLINLTILARAVENIQRSHGIEIDVQALPLDNAAAFELLGRGDTTGIFQLESQGMRRYVAQLKPTSVRDLAAMVALYRPGPMAHIPTFIRAKNGHEKIRYPHPILEEVLEETYGVIVYQDQVMRIAQVVANYTLGQADLLRRAMGKKKREEMAKERSKFVEGAEGKGISAKKAGEIFDLIEPFAGYAFNKAHAVCYAMIAYQTAYLKANFPVDYMAALLSCYIDKPDKIAIALDECKRMGLTILRPDINLSAVDFTAEAGAVRFGLVGIKNVGRSAVEAIVAARAEGEFASLEDLCIRTQNAAVLGKATLEALIHSSACDAFSSNRKALCQRIDAALDAAARAKRDKEVGQASLFGEPGQSEQVAVVSERISGIADYSPEQRLAKEKELLGFFLSGHPLEKYAEEIARVGAMSISQVREAPDREQVVIAGMISTVKPFRSKKNNEPMAFITVEDLTGPIVVTIFPSVFREAEAAVLADNLVVVRGRCSHRDRLVESEDGERNVEILADSVTSLSVGKRTEGAGASDLHIRIDRAHSGRLAQLKAQLELSPGRAKVFLHVPYGLRVRTLVSGLQVEPSAGLRERLRSLLGDQAVEAA